MHLHNLKANNYIRPSKFAAMTTRNPSNADHTDARSCVSTVFPSSVFRHLSSSLIVFFTLLSFFSFTLEAQIPQSYRFIGPGVNSGRVSDIEVDSKNPRNIYVAVAIDDIKIQMPTGDLVLGSYGRGIIIGR